MSMPHVCRCGICGRDMQYGLVANLSNGTAAGSGVSGLPLTLSGGGELKPPCCHKCNGNRTHFWMIVCPKCGNKRCPKASDHELACTNSNEPGQPGSVY